MNEQNNKTFEVDGTRPIDSGDLEVADTYEEDGIRPIAESPAYLVRDNQTKPDQSSTSKSSSDQDEETKEDQKSTVGSGGREVVDTFEADGTRPIMSNKYEIVDTLDIDGERPITSEQG